MKKYGFRHLLVVGLSATFIFLQGAGFLGSALVNLGMIDFRNALLLKVKQSDLYMQPSTYDLYGVLTDSDSTLQFSSLRLAAALNPSSPTVRWVGGRIALALDNPTEAAALLKPVWKYARENPLFYRDAWLAFSYGDQPIELIALYESIPEPTLFNYQAYQPIPEVLRSRIVNDALALAWLELDNSFSLERARELRPDDLYVNYQLMRKAVTFDDGISAVKYRHSLENFSLEAIWPTDIRLLNYTVEVIPILIDADIWRREQAYSVIAFLLRVLNADMVPALEYLTARYPSELAWKFYLAESYQRIGQLQKAETVYLDLVKVDADYAQAYLRLGELSQQPASATSDTSQLQEALGWYERYLEIYPDDLLAWKKSVEIYDALDNRDSRAEIPVQSLGEWIDYVVNLKPTVVVDQTLENGWTFLGYRGDEERLVKNETSMLILYWQGPLGQAPAKDEGWYYHNSGIWLQVIEYAQSLLLDGSFNWTDPRGYPVSFPYDIYNSNSARKLSTVNTKGKLDNVALLDNVVNDERSSFSSLHFPVKSGTLYLQAGWILSDEGSAFLGRRWSGYIARGSERYNYVIAKAQPTDWQYYAGMAYPITGTKWVEIWLLNYKAVGAVYFDDILLVEIGDPGN